MANKFSHIILLFKRLGLALVLFTVCRLLFLIINHSYFSIESWIDGLFIMAHGIRFDLSAACYLYSPFILLHALPFPVRNSTGYQRLLKAWFVILVFAILFANLADIMYFQYTSKRATADAMHLMVLGGDFIRLLPQFLTEFWYLVLIWIGLTWYMARRYDRIGYPEPKPETSDNKPLQWALLFAVIAVMVIVWRGGLQLKPIGIIDAGANTSPRNIPLVLNTPFSVLTTLGKDELVEQSYYGNNELNAIYNPVHRFTLPDDSTRKLNVVVIILESFSSEYSAVFGERVDSYTPNLDSIADSGMAFLRCFANGRKSIEGIPAVTAAMPTLMNEPYITSVFAGNAIKGIAGNLHDIGYASSFYHGGSNGTMGFESFSKVAGYERYYGRNEYGNEADFDGNWGICDEEFFQYFKNGLDREKEPFTACFVSLSSHNPYRIPERYDALFKGGPLPIHKSVQYADYSLGKFFRSAAKSAWFSNTLFVITADHCAPAEDDYYKNRVGMYAIPLVFYHPGSELQGVSMRITQQADVMPSILDYLGYNRPFIAFGNSLFDENKAGFSVNFLNGLYQLIQGQYVLHFNGEESVGLYNFRMDWELSGNLVIKKPEIRQAMEPLMKGIIQSYNHRLLRNQLVTDHAIVP